MMWMKMLCLMMVCRGVAADELLGAMEALGDAAGCSRVTLCMGSEGGAPRCAGVLWRGIWVLARASCLDRPLHKVLVMRDCKGYTCLDLEEGAVQETRRLRGRLVHPAAGADLALLALDRRYWQLEPSANFSANHLLSQYTPWMEEVYSQYPMDRSKISYAHKSSLFSSPLRMFMTTILVPSITFMAIFVYVIFFTGPNDEISYKNIQYKESENSVKCP